MISRNLSRRLKELEARIGPAEPTIIELAYVSPDGSQKLECRFEVPTSTDPTWLRRLREQGLSQLPADKRC
jgi:hypothetical protein